MSFVNLDSMDVPNESHKRKHEETQPAPAEGESADAATSPSPSSSSSSASADSHEESVAAVPPAAEEEPSPKKPKFDLGEITPAKIKRQIEFYFSDSNYRRDKWLQEEAAKHPEGCTDRSTWPLIFIESLSLVI